MKETKLKLNRGRPKTFNREHAIEVAIMSYWQQGPNGVSLNEICRRAMVSKPSLYREFGNEDGLMDAVLHCYSERVLEPLVLLVQDDRPFSETLQIIIDILTTKHETRPTGCLLAKLRSSTSNLGPMTNTHINRLSNMLVLTYIEWVDRAKFNGEINKEIDTEFAAHFIDAQLNHVLGQLSAGMNPGMIRDQAQLAFYGLLNK